ncbi:hypothetical protein F0169_11265 [Pseudomonas sp. MAFF 212408]|uniref:Uncharacterized protein n=1 Tax=Pseudomonas kitaguniensis TaxID=2607908 RepID=A0A5N7KKC2_9PSED|nr:hypothetical protein [Pseudomonas kitaguniensis]
MASGLLWRAGLLALGCEAAPKPANAFCLDKRGVWIRAASRPSASKPARHSKPAQHGNPASTSPRG